MGLICAKETTIRKQDYTVVQLSKLRKIVSEKGFYLYV